jgi:anti-sigma regulatory factor (Ser/Thr protein kinase)
MIWGILKKQELRVDIPNRFDRITAYAFINQIIDENYDSRCSNLVFDFSKLRFIDPAGVTVLSNLIEFLKLLGVKIQITGHQKNNVNKQAIEYLDDSGFFNHYLRQKLNPNARVRQTTLPLELVDYTRSYEYMGFTLLPWLSRILHVDEKALSTIKVCFQEIFNNIKDHSQVNVGCIYAQHYPNRDNKNQIIIAISDFGVGIPFNVKKQYSEISDHEAIDKACEEGYTTQTTGKNRGAGLDVLIKNVVSKNGGTILIQSCHGIVTCIKRVGETKRIPREAPGFYPGTMIQLSLEIDKFVYDEFDEEFEWF